MSAVEVLDVSPARLATLLVGHRTACGLELNSVAQRSNGAFTPSELGEIERGSRRLGQQTVAALMDLYQVDETLLPPRSDLVVDLVDRRLRAGAWNIGFESPDADGLLSRYAELVQDMRGPGAGTSFSIRSADIDVLGRSLGHEAGAVRPMIQALLEPPAASRPRLRAAIVAAVGLGAIGASAGALMNIDINGGLIASPAAAEPEPASTGLGDRGAEIEAAIPWDFRRALPSWTIIHASEDSRWRGITNSHDQTITLYDRPGTSIDEAAAILAHEIGHAVDLEHLDSAGRREWMSLRGIGGAWWAATASMDFSVGAGDFAEGVAAYLLDSPTRSPHGALNPAARSFIADLVPRPN